MAGKPQLPLGPRRWQPPPHLPQFPCELSLRVGVRQYRGSWWDLGQLSVWPSVEGQGLAWGEACHHAEAKLGVRWGPLVAGLVDLLLVCAGGAGVQITGNPAWGRRMHCHRE